MNTMDVLEAIHHRRFNIFRGAPTGAAHHRGIPHGPDAQTGTA